MSISATIIGDSINPAACRLTTFILTYPRFIHSEFMTHRCFSRNAASSRAIPIEKMLAAVRDNPVWPTRWGSNKPGMQDGGELDNGAALACQSILRLLQIEACSTVQAMSEVGLHKQVANRYLEPWGHITVIATAPDWGLANFFNLRANPMAQPEFQVLAYRMLAAYIASMARLVGWGGWHIPFIDAEINGSIDDTQVSALVKSAVGRCARVSYLRQDDDTMEKNIELHDRLAASGHWSPFEHVAQAKRDQLNVSNFDRASRYIPLSRWEQYRKTFATENQFTMKPEELMAAKPAWVTL